MARRSGGGFGMNFIYWLASDEISQDERIYWAVIMVLVVLFVLYLGREKNEKR